MLQQRVQLLSGSWEIRNNTGEYNMSGVIVGISGGDLQSTAPLNEYAISLTGKEHPHVLFIPTASYDAEGYIENIEKYYGSLRCTVSALCIITKKYSEEEIENMFQEADLIYVGGGDTEEMMKRWQECGVDKAVQKAYKDGKILTGISAGTIIWFQYGFSDSDSFKNPDDWDYKFVEGMGTIPYAICPHYNEEGRNRFDGRLKEIDMEGIALENDTAIIIADGEMSVKKAREEAKAFWFKKDENGYRKILV